MIWYGNDEGIAAAWCTFITDWEEIKSQTLIADILWFGFLPFFFFFIQSLCILALIRQSKLWLGSPLCSKEFNSAGQAPFVWTVGVDEESCGLSLTLCVSSSAADGIFTSWWQKSHGIWGIFVDVCVLPFCFWLLFLAQLLLVSFSFPPALFLASFSCLPRSIFYFLCSSCHCLSTLPCLCYYCFLMFSLILSGDFPDLSPPENHPSPFPNWTNTSATRELLSLQLYLVLSFFLHCGGSGEKCTSDCISQHCLESRHHYLYFSNNL